MPAIPKTSDREIIDACRMLLEQQGEQALTMQRVSEMVGIKGPSLYKRFADREALFQAVESDTFQKLELSIRQHSSSVEDMANAYLDFARSNPVCYRLLFRSGTPEHAKRAVEPLLELLGTRLVDSEDLLVRARIVTSFLHGYATMETAGAFRLGGDPKRAIKAGLKLILPEEPTL